MVLPPNNRFHRHEATTFSQTKRAPEGALGFSSLTESLDHKQGTVDFRDDLVHMPVRSIGNQRLVRI